jgi:uncharacterized protein (DUF58 family)
MQVFRSKFPRLLAGVSIGILLLAWILTLVSQGVAVAVSSAPTTALFAYLALIVFWIPKVSVTEEMVQIGNILRTHNVSLAAIKRIDTKWALTLFTEKAKYSAWGAPAPGRHSSIFASRDQGSHLPESTYLAGTVRPGDLISSDSGAPAAYIRRLWEQRKPGVAIESTRWHIERIVILGALLALNLTAL